MKVFLFMGYYSGGPSYIMASGPLERTGLGPWDLGFLESIHMIRAEVSSAFPILASS